YHNALHEQVKGLQSLGYQIIPIHPTEETPVDEQTYPTVADFPGEVDVVLVHNETLSTQFVDQLIETGEKILWIEKPQTADEALKRAQNANLTVITGRSLCEEALRARGTTSTTTPIKVEGEVGHGDRQATRKRLSKR